MSVLAVEGIYKGYGGIAALTDVSLEFERGEVHAIVGKNGAGKSTLVNLLSGAIQPDRGQISLDGTPRRIGSPVEARRLGIVTVHQELTIVPGLNVADNVMLGRWGRRGLVDPSGTVRAAKAALRRLGSSLEPLGPTAHLSIAEWQIIELARAITQDVRILILDEPTSALSLADADILIKTVRALAHGGVTVLYVSHRLDEIARVADRVSVFRDGAVVGTRVAPNASYRELVRMMIGTEAVADRTTTHDSATAEHEPVLRLASFTVPNRVFDITVDLRRGEILGLAGLVGAGCSEVLRSVYGMVPGARGELVLAGDQVLARNPRTLRKQGVALVTNDRKREGLFMDQSVLDNIAVGSLRAISRAGVISETARHRVARAAIRRFDVKVSDVEQPVRALSGGNQQKVVLARNLASDVQVLILDEPTRGIDIEAKLNIYQLLRDLAGSGTSVLVSFSEFDEFPLVCDRVVVMRAGLVAGELGHDDLTAEGIAALAAEAA